MSRLFARLALVALAASVTLGCGLAVPGLARAIDLPDTTTGVHVGLPFVRCYEPFYASVGGGPADCDAAAQSPVSSLEGKVDVGWMWNYNYDSPAQLGINIAFGASLHVDRFPAYLVNSSTGSASPVSLQYWQQNHPDWIEYTCATNSQGVHTTPAWEFGDLPQTSTSPAYVPFDITNPAAMQYYVDTFVLPSLQAGYPMIFVDNFSLQNSASRCGHYNAQGQWVQDYSGASDDPTYQADVLNWLQYLANAIHAYNPNAIFAINYNPVESGDPPSLYDQVFNIADMVWEEGGFTDWGQRRLSGTEWNEQFAAMSDLAAQTNKAVFINGIAGGINSTSASQIAPDDRQWVIANYLLVKGSHTYTDVLPNEYGYYIDWPEYHIPIGSAQGPAYQDGSLWLRNFTGGLAIVNSTTQSQNITIPAGYTNTQSQPIQGMIAIAPTDGLILLNPDGAANSGIVSSVTTGSSTSSTGSTVPSGSQPSGTEASTASAAPTISQVSLAGVARRQPRLALSVTKGGNVKGITEITLRLTRGLAFAVPQRHLQRYITVTAAAGRRLGFTARLDHGTLSLILHSTAATVRVTIFSPALAATRQLAGRVRRKLVGRVQIALVGIGQVESQAVGAATAGQIKATAARDSNQSVSVFTNLALTAAPR